MEKYNSVMGKGSFGTVFAKTKYEQNEEKKVLKKFNKTNEENYKKEKEIIQKLCKTNLDLRHTTILCGDKYFVTDGNGIFGIYFKYCEKSLESKLKSENNSLPVSELFHKIFVASFSVLEQLHKNNLYHGDIKPANIMICKDMVKIIDFSENETGVYTPEFYIYFVWDGESKINREEYLTNISNLQKFNEDSEIFYKYALNIYDCKLLQNVRKTYNELYNFFPNDSKKFSQMLKPYKDKYALALCLLFTLWSNNNHPMSVNENDIIVALLQNKTWNEIRNVVDSLKSRLPQPKQLPLTKTQQPSKLYQATQTQPRSQQQLLPTTQPTPQKLVQSPPTTQPTPQIQMQPASKPPTTQPPYPQPKGGNFFAMLKKYVI